MRVLILEDDPMDAMAMHRVLADRFDVVLAATLNDALLLLGRAPSPEIIVTDLNLPDSRGPATLQSLRAAAPDIPIVVSTGHLSDTIKRQLDLLGAAHLHDKNDGFGLLRMVLHQTQTFHQTLANQKTELLAEIGRVSRLAADEAASRAVVSVMRRLGLDDEEGVRMAVRLARGWDAAKHRFMTAMATGLASAVLIAIGAGIVAILRNHAPK